jgi:hypothetical protein
MQQAVIGAIVSRTYSDNAHAKKQTAHQVSEPPGRTTPTELHPADTTVDQIDLYS